MSRTLMLYLSTAFLLVTLFADAPAHGQRCAYSEGPVESCGYPRTISGTPGQHVVYMDTTDSSISTTLCGSSVTNVVWFEVRPTVSGPLIFSTCHPLTSYDTVVVAYSGGNTECQGITEVTCNDDDQSDGCDNGCSYRASTVTIPNAIANTWYRFAVGEYSGSSGTCTNCLGVVVTIGTPCGDAPTNFICELAKELEGFPGTHSAEYDVTDAPDNVESVLCPGSTTIGHSVWFTFTPTVEGQAVFSTCDANTAYDTVARVVGGCGGMVAQIACNDDTVGCTNDCGSNRGSRLEFDVSAGVPYYIEVGSYGNGTSCDLCLGVDLTISECTIDVDCDDSNPCTADECDAGICYNDLLPLMTPCPDDGNDCTDDYCYHGGCMHFDMADGVTCGNSADTYCDNPDTCNGAGACQNNNEPYGATCTSDSNQCTDDICNGDGACTHPSKPNGSSCGSGSNTDCDDPDTCQDGSCWNNYEPYGTACTSDGNECTDDICNGTGTCAHPSKPNGSSCGSGSNTDCDDPDTCQNGSCLNNNEPYGTACTSDGNECTDDFCNGDGACTHPNKPNGSSCGSGSNTDCDDPDTCQNGSCLNNNEPYGTACTDDGQECTDDLCDGDGECTHPNLPDGSPCGDPSNTDCDDPDSCDGAGSCLSNHNSNGSPCPNGLFCDGAEVCDGEGICQPGEPPCSVNEICDEVEDECDPISVDLMITDIWLEADVVCYQLRNIGGSPTADTSYTALFVDDEEVAVETEAEELGGGARRNRCFAYQWGCSGSTDSVRAVANHDGSMAELDVENSTREEVWRCDTQPPSILTGPSVSNITQTSATVTWETDELSDSVVHYSRHGPFRTEEVSDASLVTAHQMALSSLERSTTYYVTVSSTDSSENTLTSSGVTFATLFATDDQGPAVSLDDPGTGRGVISVSAQAYDDVGVAKVELYVGGELHSIDYASPYDFILDTRLLTNETHELMAKAYDAVGNLADDSESVDVANPIDKKAPIVVITTPTQDAHVGGLVMVAASLSDDTGLVAARFYVDGEYTEFQGWDVSNPPTSAQIQFIWDSRGYTNGSQHRLGIEAYDNEGKLGVDAVDVVVTNLAPPPLPMPPRLIVTDHTVSRNQNQFTVTITIKNDGDIDATNVRIKDSLYGFQAISSSDSAADFLAGYHPPGEWGYMDIRPKIAIPAGASRIYTYNVVPVLFQDSHTYYFPGIYAPNPQRTPKIGPWTDLQWDSPTTSGLHSFVQMPPATLQWLGETVADAHKNALKLCDYLIVTNPYRAFLVYAPSLSGTTWRETNELLSTMAELAYHKKGALGYMVPQTDLNLLDKLIKPWGNWAGQLAPEFSKVAGGYLLLVGETEILGWCSMKGWDIGWSDGDTTEVVHLCDNCFADTSGDFIPDLITGRIIGDSPSELANAIQNSIDVFDGTASFNHRDIEAVSGVGSHHEKFVDAVNVVATIFNNTTFNVDKLHWKDYVAAQRVPQFINRAPNRDYFFLRGHGTPDSFCALDYTDVPSVGFGSTRPVFFAASCLTANYECWSKSWSACSDEGLAERLFDQGAGVYIGATEVSHTGCNTYASKKFFNGVKTISSTPSVDSLGQMYTKMERELFPLGYKYKYWVAEYNWYGDPKFAQSVTSPPGSRPEPELPVEDPPTSLEITVPMYEVSSSDGFDHVEIPGGEGLQDTGQPEVPIYQTTLEYPAGYEVLDVTLIERTGLITDTGLILPVVEDTIDGAVGTAAIALEPTEEAWHPAADYTWHLAHNPDGSSTLSVVVYPFYYSALTTNSKFYANYVFDIPYATSDLSITDITVAGDAHAPGDAIMFDIGLLNTGASANVTVSGSVKPPGFDDGIDGVLLRTIPGLVGSARTVATWDSTGFAPGEYGLAVELLNADGIVMARGSEAFNLGVVAAEIGDFSVTPDCLAGTNELQVSLTATNTGALALDGKVIVGIFDRNGNVVLESRHDVIDLEPLQSTPIVDSVDISGASEDYYRLIAYMLYDGKSTDIENATLTACLSGDFDADGKVDLSDHAAFAACISGPERRYESHCSCFDFDGDDDVDMTDASVFADSFTGVEP